ncbi:MAG: NAD(P)H-dependent oxidoreductase [Methanocalculaceae archaeon]|nr:NAD(P)H-dependent oxidoreductase [Methanocalculaceae archaeon]
MQEDDFQKPSQKMFAADVLILASSVYSLSVCAQAKALFNRCHVFWSQKCVLHSFREPAGKKISLFVAQQPVSPAVASSITPSRLPGSPLTSLASNRNTQCLSASMILIRRPTSWKIPRWSPGPKKLPPPWWHPSRDYDTHHCNQWKPPQTRKH